MFKKFLIPLVLVLLTANIASATPRPNLSYEQERENYLKVLRVIVKEAKNSGIVTDVKLKPTQSKEQENKIDKLKKDLQKAIGILEKNKVKLGELKLQDKKLVATNEKIIASFEHSIIAMKLLHQSINNYDIFGFIKGFKDLKEGDKMLQQALEEIEAQHILRE